MRYFKQYPDTGEQLLALKPQLHDLGIRVTRSDREDRPWAFKDPMGTAFASAMVMPHGLLLMRSYDRAQDKQVEQRIPISDVDALIKFLLAAKAKRNATAF